MSSSATVDTPMLDASCAAVTTPSSRPAIQSIPLVQLRADQLRYYDLMEKYGGQVLCDATGFGKTLAAIHATVRYVEQDPTGKRQALVVTPTTLVDNFHGQMTKYGVAADTRRRIHVWSYDALVAKVLPRGSAAAAKNKRKAGAVATTPTSKKSKGDDGQASSSAGASSPSISTSSSDDDNDESLSPTTSVAPKDVVEEKEPDVASRIAATIQSTLDASDLRFSQHEWALIVDESHTYRNPDSQRGQFMRALASLCARVLCLTATPCVNTIGDLCNQLAMARRQLQCIRPKILGFWCQQAEGADEPSLKRLDLFLALCRNWVSFSVLDESEFPRLNHQVVSLEMSEAQYHRYREVEMEFSAAAKSNRKRLLNDDGDEEQKDGSAFYSGLRKYVNLMKGDQLGDQLKVQWIVQLLASKPRAVIFSNFLYAGLNAVDEACVKAYPDIPLTRITGEQADGAKRQAVANAYNTKTAGGRTLLLSQAGGTGLDLQRTQEYVEMEACWNQANSRQQRGRVRRFRSHADLPEAERYVNVHQLIVDKPRALAAAMGDTRPSVDRYLLELARAKQEPIDRSLQILCKAEVRESDQVYSYEELLAFDRMGTGLMSFGNDDDDDDVSADRTFPVLAPFRREKNQIVNEYRTIRYNPRDWFKHCTMGSEEWRYLTQTLLPKKLGADKMPSKSKMSKAVVERMMPLREMSELMCNSSWYRRSEQKRIDKFEEANMRLHHSLIFLQSLRVAKDETGRVWTLNYPAKISRTKLEIGVTHRPEAAGAESVPGWMSFDTASQRWVVNVGVTSPADRDVFEFQGSPTIAMIDLHPLVQSMTPFYALVGRSIQFRTRSSSGGEFTGRVLRCTGTELVLLPLQELPARQQFAQNQASAAAATTATSAIPDTEHAPLHFKCSPHHGWGVWNVKEHDAVYKISSRALYGFPAFEC